MEEKQTKSGEVLLEETPELEPETQDEQTASEVIENVQEAMTEVKKIEIQALSDVISNLTSLMTDGQTLQRNMAETWNEVNGLKLELAQALQETKLPQEQPPTPTQDSSLIQNQKPIPMPKKKIKLF